MNIWWELSHKVGQVRGYDKMIGNTKALTTLAQSHGSAVLYVPLTFFHCRNDGLALPLIALNIVGQKSIQPQTCRALFEDKLVRDPIMISCH